VGCVLREVSRAARDVTPSTVPAHCAGTGQGNALTVIAKPPPHLRYVQVLCGEAIQG
jgi:hypothetical protein